MSAFQRAIVLVAALLVSFAVLVKDKPFSIWSSRYRRPITLRQRLAQDFPYDRSEDLPKNIWQTWKHSPSEDGLEEVFLHPVSSWSTRNPGFHHQVVTDEEAASMISSLFPPQVSEAYDALPKPVLKADFFRYLILLARGGIYTDIDTTALKPAANWVPRDMLESFGLVVGIEADPDRADWQDWYARRIQFCQWTIMSKPGHPVLVDIVASITEETLTLRALNELQAMASFDGSVVEYTGPGIWTDSLFNYINSAQSSNAAWTVQDPHTSDQPVDWHRFAGLKKPMMVKDVVVLPITSFSPGVGDMGSEWVGHPLAYVLHGFSGTWRAEH